MHCVARKQHECSVSRGLPLGHGCRYTDAAALYRSRKRLAAQRQKKLGALRELGNLGIGLEQSMKPLLKNMWVWAREGNGMTGRSSSEVAPRTSPGR